MWRPYLDGAFTIPEINSPSGPRLAPAQTVTINICRERRPNLIQAQHGEGATGTG
jgi:hypothetical protein